MPASHHRTRTSEGIAAFGRSLAPFFVFDLTYVGTLEDLNVVIGAPSEGSFCDPPLGARSRGLFERDELGTDPVHAESMWM
eukprot:3937405-Rhodomonas_salina.4